MAKRPNQSKVGRAIEEDAAETVARVLHRLIMDAQNPEAVMAMERIREIPQ